MDRDERALRTRRGVDGGQKDCADDLYALALIVMAVVVSLVTLGVAELWP